MVCVARPRTCAPPPSPAAGLVWHVARVARGSCGTRGSCGHVARGHVARGHVARGHVARGHVARVAHVARVGTWLVGRGAGTKNVRRFL